MTQRNSTEREREVERESEREREREREREKREGEERVQRLKVQPPPLPAFLNSKDRMCQVSRVPRRPNDKPYVGP